MSMLGRGWRRDACVALLLGVCSVSYCAQGARDGPSEARSQTLALDTFADEYVHLHVAPSTHRISLRHDRMDWLAYSFFLRAPARAIKLVLPPGYKPLGGLGVGRLAAPGCEVLASPDAGLGSPAYSRYLNSTHLVEFITRCQVAPFEAKAPANIWIHFKEREPGLSTEEPPRALHAAHWWYVYVYVQLPQATPRPEANIFTLDWAAAPEGEWQGSVTFAGWPLLGDWDCAYSDWEGWGSCSARCGGGYMRLRRTVLMEPPDDSLDRACKEELSRDVPCNEHPCLWPCEREGALATADQPGVCTAMCGGGLLVQRQRWKGDNCPAPNDVSAVRLKPCNNEPCQAPCVRSDKWTAVTECSQQCGYGTFWLMQVVVQKDINHDTCAPFWRQQKCMKQECERLVISRPDRNLVPQVNSSFRVGVIFQMPEKLNARRIELFAPDGYSFGVKGAACLIHQHDLMPHFGGCEVGQREDYIILSMATPLPPNDWGNHHFLVDVLHPDCGVDDWVVDPLLTTLRCHVDSDMNRWRMEFADASPKSSGWETYIAAGYGLYAPTSVDDARYSFRDKEDCTGQIRWYSSQLCVDMSGDTAAVGANIELYNCSRTRRVNQEWIVPPAGSGKIANGADEKKCVGIRESGSDRMFIVVECGDSEILQLKFIMPPLGVGLIRWAADPQSCLAAVEAAQGAGRPVLKLTPCTDDMRTRWETPCDGDADADEDGGSAHKAAAVQVLAKRQRPRFCSPRHPCPSGARCSEDGVCDGFCPESPTSSAQQDS